MASTLRTVTNEIVTALKLPDGSSPYNHTLNDEADRVLIGVHWPPTLNPQVFIQDVSMSTVVNGVPLGQYRRVARFTIVGFVGANSTIPGARALEAMDLLDDLCTALEVDRTLGGNVYDVTITGSTAIDGFEEIGEELGACGLICEVYWETSTGA